MPMHPTISKRKPYSPYFNPNQFSPALWLDGADASTLLSDGAASFASASSQSLSKASTSLSNNDEDIWVSLWAKTSSDATQGIFGKWNYSADGEYLLSKISATTLRFTRLTSAGQISTDITYSMTIGSWFHIFLTHDKTNNYYKLFINNALVTTFNYTGTVTATANPFVLGWNSNAGYFNGFIDSAAFGKPASGWIDSNAEALASYLYNSGAGRRSSDFINSSLYSGSGAVSWWDLDERSGTRKDRIGSNDLTDNNSVGYASGVASGLVQYDGDPIRQWSDKSGNARHATAASDSVRPTYKVGITNGRSVVRYDGTDDILSIASSTAYFVPLHSSPTTVFAVVNLGTTSDPNALVRFIQNNASSTALIGFSLTFDDRTASSNNNTIQCYTTNGASPVTISTLDKNYFTPATPGILSLSMDPANATAGSRYTVRVNGGNAKSTNAFTGTASGANSTNNLSVGGTGMQMDFLELIIYFSALSTSQRQQVERYLGNKWGITLS